MFKKPKKLKRRSSEPTLISHIGLVGEDVHIVYRDYRQAAQYRTNVKTLVSADYTNESSQRTCECCKSLTGATDYTEIPSPYSGGQSVSLCKAIESGTLWAQFAAALGRRTMDSMYEAASLGEALREIGGSIDLVEAPNSCEVLCNWVRGLSAQNWPALSEDKRTSLTDQLWKILEAGGVRKRINYRALPTPDGHSHPALHLACGFGLKRAVEIILTCPETDVNACNHPNGETAAMYCLRFGVSAPCFELLLSMRLLDLDLDLKAADGLTMQAKIDAINITDLNLLKLRGTWTAAMHWLRLYYFPTIQQFLKAATFLPLPVIAITMSLLRPESLPY
jgi:hypothetical protein